MTEARSAEPYLRDVIIWGQRIAPHIAGFDEGAFRGDVLVQNAVCFCVAVMGEAAHHAETSWPELKRPEREFHARAAYGARNALIHGYRSIDLAIPWITAAVSAPAMVKATREILDVRSAQDDGGVS